jgi:hypothetical protein
MPVASFAAPIPNLGNESEDETQQAGDLFRWSRNRSHAGFGLRLSG